MAWVNLSLPALQLNVRSDGWLEWNAALQILMDDPGWVDVMWDAATRQLGIRESKHTYGIPVVREPEAPEYKANAVEVFDVAGITLTDVTGIPEIAVEPADVGGSGWFGHGPIYYLILP